MYFDMKRNMWIVVGKGDGVQTEARLSCYNCFGFNNKSSMATLTKKDENHDKREVFTPQED